MGIKDRQKKGENIEFCGTAVSKNAKKHHKTLKQNISI